MLLLKLGKAVAYVLGLGVLRPLAFKLGDAPILKCLDLSVLEQVPDEVNHC
ncbi:MAG: hypothetical protein H6933_02635 [Burkholderiaceae bacterium]|nr:hypothetical protein [Burkholderiaceae bacterium]